MHSFNMVKLVAVIGDLIQLSVVGKSLLNNRKSDGHKSSGWLSMLLAAHLLIANGSGVNTLFHVGYCWLKQCAFWSKSIKCLYLRLC